MNAHQAIELLKKAVKESNIKNQKHIDLTLIPAHSRLQYLQAMKVLKDAVKLGQITKEEAEKIFGP